MFDIACTHYSDIDVRLDNCSQLQTVDDGYFDLLISNYVLIPRLGWNRQRLSSSVEAKRHGYSHLFSHPCFDFGYSESSADGENCCFSLRWRMGETGS